MGKGDKKTKRGKIFNGSYGARRPRKSISYRPSQTPVVENIEIEEEVKVPAPKKKIKTSAPR